jgi:hypothetical protein
MNYSNPHHIDSLESIVPVLEMNVRLSSESIAVSTDPWAERATIVPLLVDDIPLLLPHLISPERGTVNTDDQLWSILTRSYFRNGPLEVVERHREQIQQIITEAIERQQPVPIVLPTIPFKDQNATTTRQPVGVVDLGEHAFVAQLRDLVHSVRTVYEPGLDLVLIADGQIYRDIFTSATESEVSRYTQNLTALIERYDLTDQIRIVDFSDIIDSDEGFQSYRSGVEDMLSQSADDRVTTRLYALQRGMLVNCELPYSSLEAVEHYRCHPTTTWPEAVQSITSHAARRYAAFLITACHRQSIQLTFPDALRATVHPKDAPQLPLHLVSKRNRIFPYNGIPVVKESDAGLRKSLHITRFSGLVATAGTFYQCHDGHGNTLYYMREG